MTVPRNFAVGWALFCVYQVVCVTAVYISDCPQEVVENSADVRITCTGISPSHQAVWQYQPAHHQRSDAGTCNPLPEQCLNKLTSLMTLDRTSETTSVLTIANATRVLYSGATITCSTFSRSALSGSTSCALNVIYPPEMISFTANNRDGTVTLNESDGEALALVCVADGHPTPHLTLYKNERTLRSVANSSASEKKTMDLNYYVPQSCASTGRYVCVANNTAGQQQKSLHLEILCGPRPTFPMIPTRELSVKSNLTFYITAVPAPHIFNIVRLMNGTEPAITPDNVGDFHIHCYNATLSNHVCTLTVDYVTEEDVGEYALDVSNDVRHCRFPFHLSAVHSKPSQLSFLIDNSNTSLSMNESMAALPMVCTASGSPRPDLTLKKENITLKEEQGSQSRDRKSTTLEFAVMANGDSNGVYTCVASNSAGTNQISSTVEVFCAPRFRADMAEPPIVSVDRSWTFRVTALPPPDLFEFVGQHKWTNRSKPLLHVECSPVKGAQHRCVVSVSEPTLDDKGDYTLTVGNSLGKITLTLHVDVPEERNPEEETALFQHHSGHSDPSPSDLFITTVSAVAFLIIVHIFVAIIVGIWLLRKKRNKNTTTGAAQPVQIWISGAPPSTHGNPLVPAALGQAVIHADDPLLCTVENGSEPSTARSSRTSTLNSGVRAPTGQVATSSPAPSHRDRSITHPKRADCNPQYVSPETLFLRPKLTLSGVSNPCFEEPET